ncbi:MAG: cyanoexosortase A [Pseudanabaenaceae cyanobacterium]|jgi:cyanoexosortase A
MERLISILPEPWRPLSQRLDLWLGALLSCLIGINTTLVWRLSQNNDEIAIQTLSWLVVGLLIWRKRCEIKFATSPGAMVIGVLCLSWVFVKSTTVTRYEDMLFILTPLLSLVGVILIGCGFKGLRPFWGELLLAGTLGIPTAFVSEAIERVIPINMLTAKFANMVLWYGGLPVQQEGVFIAVKGGVGVMVARGCAGLPPIFLLLRITLMFVLVFPEMWRSLKILLPVATFIAFMSNSVRVALLVLVASNQTAFDYWHDGEGSQWFAVVMVLVFLLFCNWLLGWVEQQASLEPLEPSVADYADYDELAMEGMEDPNPTVATNPSRNPFFEEQDID